MIKIIFAFIVTNLNLAKFFKNILRGIYVITKEVIPAIILGWIFWIMYCSLQPHLIQFSDFLFNNISNQEFFYNRSILCLVILIYTCCLVCKEIFDAKHPKRLTGKSIVLTAVVGVIYYITVRNDQEILLFRLFNFTNFYLLDIILLTVCISLWSYKSNAKNIHVTKKRIIEDSIHVDLKHDKLFRSKQVKELTNLIKESNPDNAISISITGEWGDGKSTFLSFVENELMNNENIVIKFNPWLGRQNISTTGIFFETLQEELSNYDSRTADKIHKYSNNILLVENEDSFVLKAIKLVLGKLIPSPSFKTISQQKDDINRSLRLIGKKIIVFIDDLDRVSPEEILDVLNLIRNTADFQNTIFLVAMDLDYIKSSLNSQNNLLNVDKYLEKIFQLQFVLSPIMFDTIKLLLENELEILLESNKDLGLPTKFSENFKEALSKISFQPDIVNGIRGISSYDRPGILEESLTNIRDIKRFLNSFIMTYKLFIGELDMLDLILLELLKLKFTHFYLQLSKGRFIVFDDIDRGKWKLDDETFTEYLKRNNDSQLLGKIVEKIYKTPETTGLILSKNSANTNRNSLIFIDNHKKYFNHDLFGDISVNALLEAKTNGPTGLEDFFKQIVDVDSNNSYTKEELDFSIQFKIGKFYMYLINYSNSPEDQIEIIHSVKFINYLPKFYLPQVLRTEILLLCRQDSYLDITSKLLLNIFEQRDIKLRFKLELNNELKKNFSILFNDEFWPDCCLRCVRSLFADLNLNEEIDSKLQEEIYVLFVKWLNYFLNFDKLTDGTEIENFKRYFMVNPKILLVGIFDFYNIRENQLSIHPHIINFFQFWDLNKPAIENYRDFLQIHINEYELARKYYMSIKLYNSSNYTNKLEEIQLHLTDYKEAVFKDNLGYLLG